MRLFVALSLPDETRAAIARLQQGLPGVRWLVPDTFHITLRFLGELDGGQAQDVDAALSRIAPPALTVTPDGVGLFGSERRPHSLWVGVRRDPALQALHDKIDRAVVSAGLPPDDRKFHPHVTIGRMRGEGRRERLHDWLMGNSLFLAPSFEAAEFVLYESHRHSEGADYQALRHYPLSGAGLADDVSDDGFDPAVGVPEGAGLTATRLG